MISDPSYIPVTEFGLSDIPEDFRIDTVLQYIRNISARTVRVARNRTSDWAAAQRIGSGWVAKVEYLRGPCWCPECKESPCPGEHCWAVIVNTSARLVSDAEEAKLSQVELFYDDQSSRAEGTAKTLYGVDLEEANPMSHVSMLVCLTHDAGLAQQLDSYRKEGMALRSQVLKKARGDVALTQYLIVCHPNGLHKHIWVRQRPKRIEPSCSWSTSSIMAYNARACLGVSGGPVVVLHGEDCPDRLWIPVVDSDNMAQANAILPTDLTNMTFIA